MAISTVRYNRIVNWLGGLLQGADPNGALTQADVESVIATAGGGGGGGSGDALTINGATAPASPVSGDVGKAIVASAAGAYTLAPVSDMLWWGTSSWGSTFGAARYFGVDNEAVQSTDIRPHRAMHAGVLKNLAVKINTAGATANVSAITIYVNGVATALTVNVTETSTTEVVDSTHTVSVAAGDYISAVVVRGGSAGAAPTATKVWVELAPL